MSPCLVLLTTPHSYRARPFLTAAECVGVEMLQVVDMPPELAEQWNYELGFDFKQTEQAIEALRQVYESQPFNTILAIDDGGTFIASLASQALGLPHNDPSASIAARDKFVMRSKLAPAGIPTPTFQRYTTHDNPAEIATNAPYPCVIKPTTRSGSQGVIRANTPDELVTAIQRLTALLHKLAGDGSPQPFLVESYIPGREVALEGLLDNGQLHVLALFDKPDPLEGPFFEETIYVTPSRLPAGTQQLIQQTTQTAAQALGLRQGPIHAELRINEQGAWLVEVAGRSIGGLCSQTLRFGVDVSLEELIVRQAAGLPIDSLLREEQARGVMMIPIPAGGLLRQVTGIKQAQAVTGIESIEITAKLHNPITPLPEGDSYLGFIFARGDTPAQVETALRQAHSHLHFTIEPIWMLNTR